MTRHQTADALQASFKQAQQQAAAMASPPPHWNAAAPSSSPRVLRRAGLALLACAAGGGALWLGIDVFGQPGSAAPTSAPGAAGPARAAAGPGPIDPGTAVQQRGALPPATAFTLSGQPATSLDVSRSAGLIRIAAVNASLPDAVRLLGRVTQTSVRGAEALAAVTTPVTLAWQGSDTASAWQALLGRFASTAVSCSGAACEVWIVGVTAAPRADAAPAVRSSAVAAVAADGPAIQMQTLPQPSSEENTETN